MAGAGYKLFNTGDVLLASEVNTYLMQQTVMVFANATARTSALSGVLAEGMISYLADTNATEVYNGSAWVGITGDGDITGVTAGTGISGGGTSGAVTITNSMATEITAKGDLIVGTGNATFDNLPVGTNDYVLTAASGEATGLKWAAAAGGALTISQIASGTLSGATVQISSLSSYDNLIIQFDNVDMASNSIYSVKLNSSTSGYSGTTLYAFSSTNSGANWTSSAFDLQYYNGIDTATVANKAWVVLTNCKASGFTNAQYISFYRDSSAVQTTETTYGIHAVASGVSSITFVGGATFTGGTYTVWGG